MSCHVGCRRGSDPRVAVAVAQAGGYGSDWTPSLGTSICCRSGPRNGKKTKRQKKKKRCGLSVPLFTSKSSQSHLIPFLWGGGSQSGTCVVTCRASLETSARAVAWDHEGLGGDLGSCVLILGHMLAENNIFRWRGEELLSQRLL